MAKGYPDYGKHINRVGVYTDTFSSTAGETEEFEIFMGQLNCMYEITHFSFVCEPYAVQRIRLIYSRMPALENICIYRNDLIVAKQAVIFPSTIFVVSSDYLSIETVGHLTENCNITVSFMYKEHYIPDDYIMEILGE